MGHKSEYANVCIVQHSEPKNKSSCIQSKNIQNKVFAKYFVWAVAKYGK
jgi:hypothetical protein